MFWNWVKKGKIKTLAPNETIFMPFKVITGSLLTYKWRCIRLSLSVLNWNYQWGWIQAWPISIDRKECRQALSIMIFLEFWANCIKTKFDKISTGYRKIWSKSIRPRKEVICLKDIIRGDAYLVGKRLWKTSNHVFDSAF